MASFYLCTLKSRHQQLKNHFHLHGELVDEDGTLVPRQLVDGRALGSFLPLLLALLGPAWRMAPATAYASAVATTVAAGITVAVLENDD